MDRYVKMIDDLREKLFIVNTQKMIENWISEANAVFKELRQNLRDEDISNVIETAVRQSEQLLIADCTRKEMAETITIIRDLITEKKAKAMKTFETLYDTNREAVVDVLKQLLEALS